MTLLEPLPVGIVMALVSAGILRRKPEEGVTSAASAEVLANWRVAVHLAENTVLLKGTASAVPQV